MSFTNTRWWRVTKRVVTLALFLIPWLLRDTQAVEQDKRVEVAQNVLTEKDAALQRQEQDAIQRDMGRTLARIERKVEQLSEEETAKLERDAFVDDAAAEGTALKKSLDVFTSLRERISIADGDSFEDFEKKSAAWLESKQDSPRPACQNTCMLKIEEEVAKVARNMEDRSLAKADAARIDDTMERFFKAHANLSIAFEDLSAEADADRETSAGKADSARNTAWFFTALGGLLVGDWKKLLAGPDAVSAETVA